MRDGPYHGQTEHETPADVTLPDATPADVTRIDAHTHFFCEPGLLGSILEERQLRVVIINITAKDFFREPMDVRWRRMTALKEAHPDRVDLCTTFDPEAVVRGADGAAGVVGQLREHVRQGAALVKVWKDVGLGVRDEDGTYVQVDDPRFQPVWDFLAAEGVPVVAHIAEPRAAWTPLDEASPHYRFYRDHPEQHLYRRDDVPSWEALIAARDRWVENNPGLTVVGAHFGSMAHDLAEVARRLDRYDNFYVDTAERFADLFNQPSERVRAFFVRYADRILYGTDVIVDVPPGTPADVDAVRAGYGALLADHARYLGGTGIVEVQDKLVEPLRVRALGLPPDVLRRVYYDNTARLLRAEAPGRAVSS